MNTEHPADLPLEILVSSNVDRSKRDGFAANEIEKIRVFHKDSVMDRDVGSISDVNWKITYRPDGSGAAEISFEEHVKYHLVAEAESRVGLIDKNNNLLASWDVAFWRDCGVRRITCGGAVSADICEAISGLNFLIKGHGQRC